MLIIPTKTSINISFAWKNSLPSKEFPHVGTATSRVWAGLPNPTPTRLNIFPTRTLPRVVFILENPPRPSVIIEYYKGINYIYIYIYLFGSDQMGLFYLNPTPTPARVLVWGTGPTWKKNPDQNPLHSGQGRLKTHQVRPFGHPYPHVNYNVPNTD